MSSHNEENKQGTMVNTQTLVTPETQKRKPRRSVVRARSKNIKLTVEWNAKGQPCNNKGGNTLVSYIGVVVRQNTTFDVDEQHKDYIMKSVGKAFREFRTNCGKCLRDAEGNVNLKPPAKYENLIDETDWLEFVTYRTQDKKFLKISEQNRKRASNPIYPYRASRMSYRGVKEKILEQSETPSPSIAAVDLDVLWVDARKNKQGVIDNEKVQEVVNRVMEAGKFVEGPEASTTVKESFTHPRKFIPIPE
ncbi:hypothetical protein Lal_00000796, partial [Lupinus albus]